MADHAQIQIGAKNEELMSVLRQSQEAVKQFGESVDKSLKTLANLGKVTAGAFGLEYAYEGAKKLTEMAEEEEKAGLRFEITMEHMGAAAGITAGYVDRLTESMKQNTVYADYQIREAVRSVVSMGDIKQGVGEVVKISGDLAFMMGTSLPQAAHEFAYAIQRPEYGVRMLARAGIGLNETIRGQIKALERAGDIRGARKLFIEEAGKEAEGAAARYRATPGGQMEMFKNEMHEAGVEVGNAILNLFKDAKPILLDAAHLIKEAAHGLSEAIKFIATLIPHSNANFRFNEKELQKGGEAYEKEIQRAQKELGYGSIEYTQLGTATSGWQGFAPLGDVRTDLGEAPDRDRLGLFGDQRTAEERRQAVRDRIAAMKTAKPEYFQKEGTEGKGGEGGKEDIEVGAEDRPFRAKIEELTAMNKRIQEAAYSDQGADATNTDIVQAVDKVAQAINDHFPKLKDETRQIAKNIKPAGYAPV